VSRPSACHISAVGIDRPAWSDQFVEDTRSTVWNFHVGAQMYVKIMASSAR
jgi:hypothetical protein